MSSGHTVGGHWRSFARADVVARIAQPMVANGTEDHASFVNIKSGRPQERGLGPFGTRGRGWGDIRAVVGLMGASANSHNGVGNRAGLLLGC